MYNKIKQYLHNNSINIEEVLNLFELADLSDGKGPFISKWDIKDIKKPTKTLLNSIVIDNKINYKEDRIKEYPSIEDQLDMIYKDQINGTSSWSNNITRIKTKYPKPE